MLLDCVCVCNMCATVILIIINLNGNKINHIYQSRISYLKRLILKTIQFRVRVGMSGHIIKRYNFVKGFILFGMKDYQSF